MFISARGNWCKIYKPKILLRLYLRLQYMNREIQLRSLYGLNALTKNQMWARYTECQVFAYSIKAWLVCLETLNMEKGLMMIGRR